MIAPTNQRMRGENKCQKKYLNKNGITLIALIITIIVMLILLGVSVSVALNGGLFGTTKKAVDETEIFQEKEMIEIAVIQAMGENRYGEIIGSELQQQLDNNVGQEKTKVINAQTFFVIKFIESERFYEVDSDGNVTESNIVIDENPGNIKIGIDGKELAGDENSPFEIWCIEDLIEWSKNYSEYKDSYIILCQNLNFTSAISYANSETKDYGDINEDDTTQTLIEEMQSGIGFTPIVSFSGVFEGNSLTISKLYMNTENKDIGLIKTNNGTIKNLTMNDSYIHGYSNIGGIVNRNNGIISNCSTTGNVTATYWNSGGIAYSNSGTIESCINKSKVYSTLYTGGIVVQNNGIITKCSNIIDFEPNFQSRGGGVCAQNNSDGTIELCNNIGNITYTGNNIGGIVGSNAGTIHSCYNSGNLIGTNFNIGGICGKNSGTVNSCYNTGDITQTTYTDGGIIGANEGTTRYCYNIGVIGKGGSICGSNSSTIDKCYYLETLLADANAISKTDEYMKSEEFISLLNSFIQSNEDEIDTRGYAKWIKGENDYPTLDFNTTWNGTQWITNE